MPIPRVIYGLAKKRAELVAELAHAEGRAEYCRAGIAAIDAVLPLWDEGKQAPVFRRRHIPKPALVPKLVRQIVNALRDAEGPLTTAQTVDAVSVGNELSNADRLALTQLVGWRLRDMRRDGRARHAGSVGRRRLWEINPTI
jgi:hypothetical protein